MPFWVMAPDGETREPVYHWGFSACMLWPCVAVVLFASAAQVGVAAMARTGTPRVAGKRQCMEPYRQVRAKSRFACCIRDTLMGAYVALSLPGKSASAGPALCPHGRLCAALTAPVGTMVENGEGGAVIQPTL